ncbi:hypothetical protein [Moraxella lacunata]
MLKINIFIIRFYALKSLIENNIKLLISLNNKPLHPQHIYQ